ncbi:MAG: HAMP domain-containing protein [Leptolyngbyaceae cyanobacterium RU_5_1]|nr:HAMP domain-containing protein [Leptolyngbyaceae cyanobacterium RU_5_1]
MAADQPDKPNPDFRTIDYFKQVIKTKRPVIVPLRKSVVTGKSSFFVAAPIFHKDTKELLYVIRIRIAASYIDKTIRANAKAIAQQVGDDRIPKYQVVDHTGRIFISESAQEIGQSAESIFPAFKQLQNAGQTNVVNDVNRLDGEPYAVVYASVPQVETLPKLEWSVIAAEPAKAVLVARRQLLLTLAVGTAVSAFGAAVLAIYLSKQAIQPILLAADALEKIGQGDLQTRLEVQGEDEIATLGTNINSMASQLDSLLREQAIATEQAQVLAEVAGSVAQTLPDLLAGFNESLDKARTLLRLDRLYIYLFNSANQGEIVVESATPPWMRMGDRNFKEFLVPEQLLETCWAGQVIAADKISKAGFPPDYLGLIKRLNVESTLLAPILTGDRLLGLLIADHCAAPHNWQPPESNFLKQLAAQLGLVIDRVTLLKQTEEQAEEQRQLKEGLQLRALELLQEVDPISRGDLTVRAKVTADEIGTLADSYNATVGSLRKIVLQVQAAAGQVTKTTNVNEVSVQELNAEASRQSVEIVAALKQIEQMTGAIRQVATNAEQAETVVQQAARTVAEGDTAMDRTVDGIQAIRATVAETAKKVKHLGESSQKISTVVELISNFAAQTNMLALNASIEASRAGEEGRGFAVVAEEVRVLARQSAEATEEIRKLVASIQMETNEVVTAMEAGTQQVVTGTKLVDDTRQSLNKITAASAQISQLVKAIANSTSMQSKAAETVTQTMKDVATIANKTSLEASHVSSSFEQLRQVAEALQTGIEQFKV